MGRNDVALAHILQGRTREARDVYADEVVGAGEDQDRWPATVDLMLNITHYPDASAAHRAAALLANDPDGEERFWLGASAALEGRRTDLEGEIEALEAGAEEMAAREDSLEAQEYFGLALGLRGFEAIRRGDPETAREALERALARLPGSNVHDFLRFQLALMLLELGELREAEKYLKSLELYSPWLAGHLVTARVEYYLGQVYEALGDVESAKIHYGRFVSWWEDCDPELRDQWESGRQALERLTRESAS